MRARRRAADAGWAAASDADWGRPLSTYAERGGSARGPGFGDRHAVVDLVRASRDRGRRPVVGSVLAALAVVIPARAGRSDQPGHGDRANRAPRRPRRW